MIDSPARLHPLFLKLAGRRVVVVGAGSVAARKIEDVVAAGADVVVVAPKANEAVQALAANGSLTWLARPFEPDDLDGAWLVFASTSDAEAQRQVGLACEARRVFCVAIDDLANATAYSAAIVRRDPYTIVISSGGASPALTRLVRETLESVLPERGWIEAAQALRQRWKRDGTPMEERFGQLVRELVGRERRG